MRTVLLLSLTKRICISPPPVITDPMPEQTETSLLDDLDSRQDAVLLQLDELNEQVERLLKQHTIGLRVVDEQEGDQDPTPAAA